MSIIYPTKKKWWFVREKKVDKMALIKARPIQGLDSQNPLQAIIICHKNVFVLQTINNELCNIHISVYKTLPPSGHKKCLTAKLPQASIEKLIGFYTLL